MTRGTNKRDGRLAGLAYRLGHAAVDFERRARALWETAEPDDPFPVELARFIHDIRAAIAELAAHLPDPTRDQLTAALREAVTSAWAALEGAWLDARHLEAVELRGRAEPEWGLDPFETLPFDAERWEAWHRAAGPFYKSLPEPLADSADLGAHVAATRRGPNPGIGRRHLPAYIFDPPMTIVQRLLPDVAEYFPALDGLEIDLSEARHRETGAGDRLPYRAWKQVEVERLHRAIVAGSVVGEVDETEPEVWISSKDASELADDKYGVNLSMSEISKLAKSESPPFKTRPKISPKTNREMQRRREVEEKSLIGYLVARAADLNAKRPDRARGARKGPAKDEVARRSTGSLSVDPEDLSRRKQVEIQKRIDELVRKREEGLLEKMRKAGQVDEREP